MRRDDKNVSAIIVAAGKGKRMGEGFNKQYIPLKEKPIVAHTLQIFENSQYIDEIILVVGKEEVSFAKTEIIEKYKFTKVVKVIEGGKERQDSVYNGLLEVNKRCQIVLIHDGARPFVKEKIIKNSIDMAEKIGAAVAAMPVKDTIKMVGDELEVVNTPERKYLWAVQTPQTFQYKLLKTAYEKLRTEKVIVTDDAMAVERLGHTVKIIEGSYENIKITTPEDLIIAKAILAKEEGNNADRIRV
ncbi:2-C-methyl-D-erythritol 4-phosphate cytidylyltransferase [Natronincola peptidivorans]|uniref:2-C-methyl-D-erythritol 4-phosphate cytidylyltransferase n=1 Tax=Natronincola peptidivorans TaxID=426128 RepID=A0A1I0GNW2_9FIRM|nr:2-C-methyl-D-erythritol 4-phosphate cytidylyltransferase [Natronincola peptidivorans]SET73010.1 2-C-methyl-D-erythritol 4-phosphate cytidylyltransferase [Natronincola peptidivorans]